jgi:cytochrome P450
MDQIIEARLRTPTDEEKSRDLFDMLLAARDPETGEAISRARLRDQMATMMISGHETTALTLFLLFYPLALSLTDRKRMAEEVQGVNLLPDGAANALAKLPCVHAGRLPASNTGETEWTE